MCLWNRIRWIAEFVEGWNSQEKEREREEKKEKNDTLMKDVLRKGGDFFGSF